MTHLLASNSGGGAWQVNVNYGFPATQNNGKIGSQTDNISGEQVVYTYDALNRLASATATSNAWGQSYSYDGFGNLTGQTVTAGSAPAYSVAVDPTTNHLGGEDANGNAPGIPAGYTSAGYDIENRYTGASNSTGNWFTYAYTPGNKRVWRQVKTGGTVVTDEITFWSANGQKLATYALALGSQLVATPTGTYYWFGGKLIKNAGGYVAADRLGSIGKFYPYGQEKPSATTNGTEKFTGYLRDSETGLDYADQRYHTPGTGRFMSVDTGNPTPANPGSWNRYTYVTGDPVNHTDHSGLIENDNPDLEDNPGGDGGIGGCFGSAYLPGPVDPSCDQYGPGGWVGCPAGFYDDGHYGCVAAPQQSRPPALPSCEISLYERPAGGKHRPWQHTYIVIDDSLLSQSGYQSDELILQAGPSNNFPIGGTLMSQVVTPGQPGSFGSNKGNASDPGAPGNKEIGSPYAGADACVDIVQLLSAIGNYNDSRQVPYAAVPIPFTGFYNSNSFTSTLLSDIGVSFGSPGFAPGWGALYSVPGLVP